MEGSGGLGGRAHPRLPRASHTVITSRAADKVSAPNKMEYSSKVDLIGQARKCGRRL